MVRQKCSGIRRSYLAAVHKIPAFKVGNAWRFKQSDLEEWISTQAAQGKGVLDGNN
ncbi:helix-turn-helix domain-containing protein [Escherichia coli]|nr:DNA-binding protein [Escherichia coli]EFE5066818.1 helix-turn-helix domain-containing protein [Escherichia coli]EFL4031662.1 helix-turn-helix domain-containing protein [Escherichia coli]EHB7755073.1 helix-turn-helix domain-containing protein [Escherichia coli]EIP3495932.1 helix-turn-helix domain-containing protein [Escherichia coli]